MSGTEQPCHQSRLWSNACYTAQSGAEATLTRDESRPLTVAGTAKATCVAWRAMLQSRSERVLEVSAWALVTVTIFHLAENV